MAKPLQLLALLAGLWGILPPCQAQTPSPRIAIILDDIGYNRSTGERALALPNQVSLAVIPFTPYSHKLASQAQLQGRDVLVHMPMESTDPERRLDQGGITLAQDEAEIRQRVNQAIASLPQAIGMNNHMGSQITIDPVIMGWVMGEVRKTPLFFIDSMTNQKSVAGQTARDYKIPSIRRDVFLDNRTDPDAIDKAFNRLIDIAKRQGHAVGIGHPHGTTLAYLEEKLPQLAQMGIELVPVSMLTAAYGRPVDQPIRLEELTRWIIAMPTPAATSINYSR